MPWLHYIEGEKNILADNLSQLLCLSTPSQIAEGKKLIEPVVVSDEEDDKEGLLTECRDSGCLDKDIYNIYECYLNLPKIPDPAQNPLSFFCICKQQQQDDQLLALQVKYPEQYIYKSLDKDVDDIICYIPPGDNPDEQWRIALPQQMLEETVKWFHQVMGHLENNVCVKHFSNATITLDSDTLLTSSSVNIARDTNCQAKDMDCYQKGKCE